MTALLHVDGLAFAVRRSGTRKTLGITIERDASLTVHVPRDFDLDRASEIIRSRLVWVHQQLARRQATDNQAVFRKLEFVDGEGVHLLGKHYRIKTVEIAPSAPPTPAIRFQGDRVLVRSDQVGSGQQRLIEYYTRAAHPFLNRLVNRWKPIVGVEPTGYVRVLDLGFHWGSCGADGTLNFHWRIMQLAPKHIDYLVVHELAHLKVSDHSAAFWGEVARVLPGFEESRTWLRDNGGQL